MAYIWLLVYTTVLMIRPQEWFRAFEWQLLGFGVLDFVAVALIVTWLPSLQASKVTWKDPPQNLLMVGLFFAALMSHVAHTYLAAFIWTAQDFGKTILFFFFVVTLLTTPKRARFFVGCLVVGALFMAVHGILQIHRGYGFGGRPARIVAGTPRIVAFGFFNDPNDLALQLVALAPFLISTIVSPLQKVSRRWLAVLLLVPVLYAVYLTNSRGGWLALAAMGMAFLYLNFSKKAGVVLAVLMLMALGALGPSRTGLANVGGDLDDSSRGRVVAWGDGNRMLKSNPLFGVGKGRFIEFSSENKVAHNSFVHTYAELGLLGYFFWLGLIFASARDMHAIAKSPAPDPDLQQLRMLARATLAGLVGFLAASFFLSRQFVITLYLFFALAAALRMLWIRAGGDQEGLFTFQRDAKFVFLLMMASIPTIWLMARYLM